MESTMAIWANNWPEYTNMMKSSTKVTSDAKIHVCSYFDVIDIRSNVNKSDIVQLLSLRLVVIGLLALLS